jgi:hypothetical protein
MPKSPSNKKKVRGPLQVSYSNSALITNKESTSVGLAMLLHKRPITSGSEIRKAMRKRRPEASTRASSKKHVKSLAMGLKHPPPPASKGSHARINQNLPTLPEGWGWYIRNGFYAACLFTWEYDCIVEIQDRALHLSTGVAPVEIVQAVLKANLEKLKPI